MAITNGYATLDELKTFLQITASTHDSVLERSIEAASRLVDDYCEQRFWVDGSPVVRIYEAVNPNYLDVHNFTTTTGLVVKTDDNHDGVYETTWTINTDFRVEPLNAAADGKPFSRLTAIGSKRFPVTYSPSYGVSYSQWNPPLYGKVEVTAKGGWATVPVLIKEATLLQASRLYKRKDSPFGISGSPEMQGELRLLNKLDPDVQLTLKPFRKVWGSV